MSRVAGWWAGREPTQQRAIRDGLIVAGLIFNATLLLLWAPRMYLWIDVEAWRRIDLSNLYGPGMGDTGLIGAFRYAPVIAWLFLPATWISWEALIGAYLALSVAAVIVMVGRRAPLFVLAFPPILLELLNGNIHLFLGLAIWAGVRWPATWAFVVLTKVTPGVGLLWFAGRREWRSFWIAAGATTGVVLIGVVIAPGLWVDWIRSLLGFATAQPPTAVPPLWVRLPMAAVLAFWAGRTGRAWLVPVAAFLALPVLWIQGLAMLTASFPLYWERARWRAGAPAAADAPATARTTAAAKVTPA